MSFPVPWQDRRRADRAPVPEPRPIVVYAGGEPYDCEPRDVSPGGTRLVFAAAPPEGEALVLDRPGAGYYVVERVWSRGNAMGVRFLAAQMAGEPYTTALPD